MTRTEFYELIMWLGIGMNFGLWQSNISAGIFAFMVASCFVKLEEVE